MDGESLAKQAVGDEDGSVVHDNWLRVVEVRAGSIMICSCLSFLMDVGCPLLPLFLSSPPFHNTTRPLLALMLSVFIEGGFLEYCLIGYQGFIGM